MPAVASLRLIFIALSVVALASRAGYAQICSGRAPFNLASTHFELDAGFNRSGSGVGVSVGHGTDNLFGIGTLVGHTADGNGRVYMIAGTLGTDQPLSPDNKFRVCPLVTVGYISGSDLAGDGRLGLSVSGDVSMLLVNTARIRVAPTIGLDFRKNVGRVASFFAQDARRSYHTFTGGIGFLIWNQLTLVPRIVVPFGSIAHIGGQVTVGYNLRRQ
jgi:hypothetical protein